MGNFARTLKLALRYRWTVAASTFCSLVVATLWGGNIGMLYPLVEVVGNNQSLSQWVDKSIAKAEATIVELDTEAARLEQQAKAAPPDEARALRRQINTANNRRRGVEADLSRLQGLKPWIDAYLPNDPFRTLVVIVVAMLVATVIKDFFLALSSFLVDRVSHLATFDLRKQFFRRTLRMDLATFNENGTSDLLSRFTHDVNSVGDGIQTLFGRAVREPLKMIVCFACAAYICWQLLLLSLILAPPAGLLIGLPGQDAQAGQPQVARGDVVACTAILAETLRRHQSRQSLHHGALRAAPLSRHQQEVLPEGHAHRPGRRHDQSGHRSDGHRDDLPGDPVRRLPGDDQQNDLWGIKMCAQPLSL